MEMVRKRNRFKFYTGPYMSDVVNRINDKELTKAWKDLRKAIRPIMRLKPWDVEYKHPWFCKSCSDPECWAVPRDVCRFYEECYEAVKIAILNGVMHVSAPTLKGWAWSEERPSSPN